MSGKLPEYPLFPSHLPDLTPCTNYRPISLLSVLSKLLEKHMRDILLDHLTQFSPISAQQWGFCWSKSATCVLLALQTFGINGWIPVLIYVQYSLTQYHTDLS